MRKLLFFAGLTALLAGCMGMPYSIGVGFGVPDGSISLGERFVSFRGDHDVVVVRRYEGFFRSLYFVVEDNDIEVDNFVVTYADGEQERFDTRMVFTQGSRSRYLPVHGSERKIRSIEFTYRTVGEWKDGRAHVQVYGVR